MPISMKVWPSCNALLQTRGLNFAQTLQRKRRGHSTYNFHEDEVKEIRAKTVDLPGHPFREQGIKNDTPPWKLHRSESISVTFTILDTTRWIQSAVSSQQSRPYLKVSRSIAPPWLVGLKRYSSNNMARLDVYRFWSCRFERRVTSNNICGGAWLNFPADEESGTRLEKRGSDLAG